VTAPVTETRLRGSLTEQRERAQLRASHARLVSGQYPAPALKSIGVDPRTAYIIDWIPDQTEDLFIILVGADRVVGLEVPKDGEAPVVRGAWHVDLYPPVSRLVRIRFAIARQLANEHTPGISKLV
jgi:hypothetical protein